MPWSRRASPALEVCAHSELSRRLVRRFDSPYRLGGARCGMPLKNKCEVSILVLPATMNKLTLQWEEPPLSMHERKWPVTIKSYRGRAPHFP